MITLGRLWAGNASRQAFQALTPSQQDDVIEFLKSLQVLPPGTPCLVVDERGNCPEDGNSGMHQDRRSPCD